MMKTGIGKWSKNEVEKKLLSCSWTIYDVLRCRMAFMHSLQNNQAPQKSTGTARLLIFIPDSFQIVIQIQRCQNQKSL
jgi:hypothetical protein